MWEKIHDYWQSFFPSTAYFLLFAALPALLIGESFSISSFDTVNSLFAQLKEHEIYKTLDDFELLKLIPIALIVLIALTIYLFDRFTNFVGQSMPPTITYHGCIALYADRSILRTFWGHAKNIDQITLVDDEARKIISEAKQEGKEISGSLGEDLQKQFVAAYQMFTYSKAGVLWSLLVLLFILGTGYLSASHFGIICMFLLLFVAMTSYSVYRQVKIQIEEAEDNVRTATSIIFMHNRPTGDDDHMFISRDEKFDAALEEALNITNLVHLQWKEETNRPSLLKAFQSRNLTRKTSGRRNRRG